MAVDSLVGTMFSGLSALVVEDVAESGGMIRVNRQVGSRPLARPSR
jgi:hypothetical protein